MLAEPVDGLADSQIGNDARSSRHTPMHKHRPRRVHTCSQMHMHTHAHAHEHAHNCTETGIRLLSLRTHMAMHTRWCVGP